MLYEDFVRFLKENNAYLKYMTNAGYLTDEEIDINDSYFEAFVWDNTPEGYDYWDDLDTDWFDLIMDEDF